MAPESSPRAGTITGINVTPLVDITLVLLIIFLVTAKLVVGQQTLDMDLPKAATGHDAQSLFSVAIAADGTFRIDGRSVSDDQTILAEATAGVERTPELRAVIQADERVAHGRVMHALDLLRRAGIARVGFAVAPIEREGP